MPLHQVLGAQADCEAAWLAGKDVTHFPSRPLFVLAVRAGGPRWGLGQGERDEVLARRLVPRVALPGQSLVISRGGPFGKVAARVMAVPGAEIHWRP